MKKDYKVETLIFHPKFTFDSEYITKDSKIAIQEKLDEYAAKGYKLASTSSNEFGGGIFLIFLYFEKDI